MKYMKQSYSTFKLIKKCFIDSFNKCCLTFEEINKLIW